MNDIPIKFYLRANHISPRGKSGKTVYSYWNYRNTESGTCVASYKDMAKKIIIKRHPNAVFHR